MISDTQLTNPSTWLRLFVDDVLRGIMTDDETALIGCHSFYDHVADQWEVSLFAAPTEICGGAADGMRVPCGLQVDIRAVASAFDSPPAVYWQAERISADDELGNHLSFEGDAYEVRVWLRILYTPPDWFEPGRRFHPATGSFEDIS